MSHKFYVTDWIPELGRYAIITTTSQDPGTKHHRWESFVFALDEEHPFFDSLRGTYAFDPSDLPPSVHVNLDEVSMHKEALGYAGNMIHPRQAKAYKKTKNKDIILNEYKRHEETSEFIVLAQLLPKYKDKLEQLAKDSWSDDLKQIISLFLRLKIKIEKI
jgi:hypothetical protein